MAQFDDADAGDRDYIPGEAASELNKPDYNVGDPNNPLCADGIGVSISENNLSVRLILYRGQRPLGHVSLRIDGMEEFALTLLQQIAHAKGQKAN